MKNQKGISLISLLLVIILICLGLFAFKYISNNKTENTSNSKDTYTTTNPTTTTNNGNNSSNNSIGLRKEFKDAMDSYESFMDEYIAFMTKYTNSKGTDMSLISDYAKYVQKCAEMGEKFDKWENNDLNADEAKYYVEVNLRVQQKLLNASIDMSYKNK